MGFLNLMGDRLKPKEVNDVLESLTNAVIELNNNVASLQTPTASNVTYSNVSSGLTADDVQDAIDELNGDITNIDFKTLTGVTPSTDVSDVTLKIAELPHGYIISGSFTLGANKSVNDELISGISFNGGGAFSCACPYSSSGILLFLNGKIKTNSALSSNSNAYYFNGVVLK